MCAFTCPLRHFAPLSAVESAGAPYAPDAFAKGERRSRPPLRGGGRPIPYFSSLSVSAFRCATSAVAPPLATVAAKSERRVVSWLIEPW